MRGCPSQPPGEAAWQGERAASAPALGVLTVRPQTPPDEAAPPAVLWVTAAATMRPPHEALHCEPVAFLTVLPSRLKGGVWYPFQRCGD